MRHAGDSGAIGRVHVNKQEIVLDIKGHRYAGHLVPCNTFMVVGTSGAKRQAKIESLMGDYVHLSHMRDVVATLEGKFTGLFPSLLPYQCITVHAIDAIDAIDAIGIRRRSRCKPVPQQLRRRR